MTNFTLDVSVTPAQREVLEVLRDAWGFPLHLRSLCARYSYRHPPTTPAGMGRHLHALERAGLVACGGRPEAWCLTHEGLTWLHNHDCEGTR